MTARAVEGRAAAALVTLELRRAAPWAALALALGALSPAATALAEQLAPRLVGAAPRPASAPALFLPDALLGLLLAALALAVARSVRPFERAPADFVTALPLGHAPVQAARALACAAVVLVAPLTLALTSRLGALALPGAVAQAPLLPELARAALVLGVALALGPLGRLGWVALGALALGAAEAHVRGARELDLLVAPRGPLLAAGVALGGVAFAALAWRAADRLAGLGRLATPGPAAGGDPWPRANARIASLLAIALLGAAALRLVEPAIAPARDAQGAVRTRRYALTYPVSHAAAARDLARVADAVHDQVAAFVGVEVAAGAPPIEVRLEPPGEPGPQDDACLRVSLDGAERHALAHLTAHRLVRGRLPVSSRASTWLLEEGLARAASWRATDGDPFWSRFHAAVTHSRRLLAQAEVWDLGALERDRGPEVVPAIGEAWVEALVRLRGPDAPSRTLDALARRLAEGKAGAPLWAAALEDVGTTPAAAWEEMLVVVEDSAPADPRSHVPLPRLRLMEEAQEDPNVLRLVAVPDGRGVPLGWDVVCRVIHDADESVRPVAALRLGPDSRGCHVFALHESRVAWGGPRPRVQLGLRPVRPAPLAGTLWEDWVVLPDPSAQN